LTGTGLRPDDQKVVSEFSIDARLLPEVLLGMTFVTGLVDAVSWLSLGHVFTALQTGNIVSLAFATAGASGFSVDRNLTSLALFLAGALLGGRVMDYVPADNKRRLVTIEGIAESLLLLAAASVSIGFYPASSDPGIRLYALIGLLALAMGLRSAVVRRLGVADLTTTVLTLTLTGILLESSVAGGKNPRIARRVASVVLLFLGALAGALLLKTAPVIPLALGGICILSLVTVTHFRR
jgi:uncharacterized membrane protein YoaK (UPF0700 family)